MKKVDIPIVYGDGSAPEMMLVAAGVVKEAARLDGLDISFDPIPMGWSAFQERGDTCPPDSVSRIKESGLVFFGGVGDKELDKTLGKKFPSMKPEAKCLLTLRKLMGLMFNFRPVAFYPELRSISKVRPDLIPEDGLVEEWVRFLLEDSYYGNKELGQAYKLVGDVELKILQKDQVVGEEELVVDLAYYRRESVELYFRHLFKKAKQEGKGLLVIDKHNVMPRYVFWHKIACRIHDQEFPDVQMEHMFSDNACQNLFNPARFKGFVIACGNEHGDVLTDGANESVGSMGMMQSWSYGPKTKMAMFESGAGTACDLAGKDKANPIGRILTGALMLDLLCREDGKKGAQGATMIRKAVKSVLVNGYRTCDLTEGKERNPEEKVVGTVKMGELILGHFSKVDQ